MFVDIHTHIDDHDPGELPGILQRARAAGVGAVIAAGTTLESSERCIQIASQNPAVFAGVGVHPMESRSPLTPAALDALNSLASRPEVVAMSEIGLDFQRGDAARSVQESVFRTQIQIARRHGLPVVWHMRESTAETLRALREEGVRETGGAAHYFQGSWEEARAVLDLNCMVSLAKPLLRLPELQGVAARLPLSSIVLETDSYPQPFKKNREKWTEPRDIALVAAKLAELKGIDVSEVEAATTANALRMLGRRAEPVRRLVSPA